MAYIRRKPVERSRAKAWGAYRGTQHTTSSGRQKICTGPGVCNMRVSVSVQTAAEKKGDSLEKECRRQKGLPAVGCNGQVDRGDAPLQLCRPLCVAKKSVVKSRGQARHATYIKQKFDKSRVSVVVLRTGCTRYMSRVTSQFFSLQRRGPWAMRGRSNAQARLRRPTETGFVARMPIARTRHAHADLLPETVAFRPSREV